MPSLCLIGDAQQDGGNSKPALPRVCAALRACKPASVCGALEPVKGWDRGPGEQGGTSQKENGGGVVAH